jgi:gliotoxin/aspirochlorine biosynthesis gamma-glutamylcyclotransferase
VKGAAELGLPASYQEYLQSLPSFKKAADKEVPGAKAFIAFWMPLASGLMRWVKQRADGEGKAPEWMGWIVWILFSALWWYHDVIHSKIWERGDGGRVEVGQRRKSL